MSVNDLRRALMRTGPVAGLLGSPITVWSAPAHPEDQALVVVFLRGAVDGLNVLVPYAEPNYYRLRSSIAIAPPGQANSAIDLDGRFGLHPALSAIKPLWDQGSLGFVVASGSPQATRSHFDAQDLMETATPRTKTSNSGWLNRLAQQLPHQNLLKALNVGNTVPRALSGPYSVAVLGSGVQATRPSALDREAMLQSLERLYANDPQLLKLARDAAQSRREIQGMLTAPVPGADPSADAGSISAQGFALDASRLGHLMRRDSTIRLAFIPVGGWDTHVNQGGHSGQLATRLQALSEGLALLVHSLGERYRSTTILVMSEFGRTARQNGSGGTDHGSGNALWLLGGTVDGGRHHGLWPGLDSSALHEGRDLAITTDFRSVLQQVVGRTMGLTDRALSSVFPEPGPDVPGLQLYRNV